MQNLLLFTFRQLKAKPQRMLLTWLSIAFGVALYISIDIVNFSTLQSFSNGIEAMTGKAQLTLVGSQAGFSESFLEKAEKSAVVQSAIPMVETHVYYVSPENGNTETLVVLGIDLLKESAVRNYKTSSKNGEEKMIDDPLVFLNQADSIILTHEFAKKNKLGLNSKLSLATADGLKPFTVRGLLSPSGPAKAYGGNMGIMDIDGARAMFGKSGKIDRIDIVPKPGIPIADVRAALEKEFSPDLQVESPASQAENMRNLVQGYQALLSFIGSLALLVGLFLVLNSMSISVAERRKEFGILRAIGATRFDLLGMIFRESLLMGLFGSLCGVILGREIAIQMVGMISRALSYQFLIPVYVNDLHLTPAHWIKGVGLGTACTVIASMIAAWNSVKIEPTEAVRGSTPHPKAPSWAPPLVGWLGLLFIVVDSKFGLSQSYVWIRALNPLCLVLGSILVSPSLVRGFIMLIRKMISYPALRLSCDNLIRNASRTGSNIMTLMVGLMLVIILALLNGSIKYSVVSWFQKTLSADLVVSSNGNLMTFQVQPLREEIAQKINTIPGVDITDGIGATAIRYLKQNYEGKVLAIKAFDPPHPRLRKSQFDVKDRDTEQAVSELFGSDDQVMMVSQNFVMHFHKKTGDTIELNTPTGIHAFKIIAVMTEFANPEGVFYLSRKSYQKFWNDHLVTGFFVMVKPGVNPTQVRDALDRSFGKELGIVGTLNASLAVQANAQIDDSFAYTKAIEWCALLVGLFGLFNTLMVSVMERKREFGILRAVGITRGELILMIFNESLLQGTLGGLVAICIGTFVTYFWVMGTLSSIMGWVLQFYLPWGAILKTFLCGVGVGILAGLIPSKHAAKIEIREALEIE